MGARMTLNIIGIISVALANIAIIAFQTAFIGAGALVGSQVSTHLSMDAIGYVGAIPALVALVWSIMIFRRWPVSLDDHQPHHS